MSKGTGSKFEGYLRERFSGVCVLGLENGTEASNRLHGGRNSKVFSSNSHAPVSVAVLIGGPGRLPGRGTAVFCRSVNSCLSASRGLTLIGGFGDVRKGGLS